MQDRHVRAGSDLRDAADISCRDDICPRGLDVLHLARLELAGNFRLQDVVGSGRTTAQVPFRWITHGKTRRLQQLFRRKRDLLTVLH